VLQTGEFSPLGSESTRHCDVRVLAAAKPGLKQLAERNEFREDLYYRLNVIRVEMPSLRERKSDIPLLAEHFLQQAFLTMKKKPAKLSAEARQILINYNFPGNVRELENIIHRAVILSSGQSIGANALPEEIRSVGSDTYSMTGETTLSFKEAKDKVVADFEKQYLLQVLEQSNGIINKAAKLAGMHTKNFHEKLTRYNIQPKKTFL
jgi:DNA-binding NtrC family response regulator